MRNFFGALIGLLIGALLLVSLGQFVPQTYPPQYELISFILQTASLLVNTPNSILAMPQLIAYGLTWSIIGIMLGVFSEKGWSVLRSTLWFGVIIATLSTTSTLILDPAFWFSQDRNITLLLVYLRSLAIAQLALPMAWIASISVDKLTRNKMVPPPERIETVCQCGAIFRSNPMLCSECGAVLHPLPNEEP